MNGILQGGERAMGRGVMQVKGTSHFEKSPVLWSSVIKQCYQIILIVDK